MVRAHPTVPPVSTTSFDLAEVQNSFLQCGGTRPAGRKRSSCDSYVGPTAFMNLSKFRNLRSEARADVFAYIEKFYNLTRRHSTIGYLSHVEFERKVGLA